MGDALVAQLFGAVQLSDVGIVLGVLLLTSIAIISLYPIRTIQVLPLVR